MSHIRMVIETRPRRLAAIRIEDNSVLQLGDLRDWLPSPAKDPDFIILRNDAFASTGNTNVVNRVPTDGQLTTIGLGPYKTNCI